MVASARIVIPPAPAHKNRAERATAQLFDGSVPAVVLSKWGRVEFANDCRMDDGEGEKGVGRR